MQQSSHPNRKRPAPGTSPVQPQQQQTQQSQSQYQYPMQDTTDYSAIFDPQNNPFVTADNAFSDPTAFANALNPPQQMGALGLNPMSSPSTDLVRLSRNQPIVPQQEQWNGVGAGEQVKEEDDEDLDVKVALAKRDAQGKRKQIPPFVQKLSSFLDSGNTGLIRWSDDGRSFIVLDEDEFARSLIPELFKHSNYASFVRQLNMYGFHKTVNITDGSLRQSEKARKGVKPPSMYSHPYFRKNRPDLLWLIQKPAGKATAKRKRDGNESDEDSPGAEGRAQGEGGAAAGGHDLAPMPRNEMASLRQDLKKVQQQQELISRMIGHMKTQNEQFYRQASAFQALHDRHENSINAILTFLATFYSRSLDGNAQNLVNMFGNHGQNSQTHGSVVEEYNDSTPSITSQLQRYVKRPPLLLPGPTASPSPSATGNVTELNSARPSTTPPNPSSATLNVPKQDARASAPPHGAASTAPTPEPLFKANEASSPHFLDDQQGTPESDQMMSLINRVNATASSQNGSLNANSITGNSPAAFDFSSALDHFQTANGNSPLTPQQRDDMLALIASQQQQQSQSSPSGNSQARPAQSNNALVSPKMPPMPVPDLQKFQETQQQQWEMLANMQNQQNAKVLDLQRRLRPLSPTGTIPGMGQTGGGEETNPFDGMGGPGEFDVKYDPSDFLNLDDHWDGNIGDGAGAGAAGSGERFDGFDGEEGTGGDGTAFNWDEFADSTNGGAEMFSTAATDANTPANYNSNPGNDDAFLAAPASDGGGKVESVGSSAATSPAGTAGFAAEHDGDGGGNGEPGTPRKRARRE